MKKKNQKLKHFNQKLHVQFSPFVLSTFCLSQWISEYEPQPETYYILVYC